jgi:hypothetical protein
VLDIYRYVCRNYEDGDDIYVFGFSRGAFTARLVVTLIAAEGLVRSNDEAELQRKSVAAYRSFRRQFLPRRLQLPTHVARAVRDAVIRWRYAVVERFHRWRGRQPYSHSEVWRPKIRFVGVWDTVAAYGGPITEITRAIDNWFFPLSMPDYRLHEKVVCARHALAIDDERDAFQPLLWDEVHEEKLKAKKEVPPDRLLQVWFTGMHADVGGGYPDESLSYVSLLWMIEEAERAGLRTLKVIKDRIVALASSYGPIHDSRAGLGAYYRYQPRKIAAWIDPVASSALSLRDPAITDSRGNPQGLLRSVKVHESVINRIATGTDRYAPITLPQTFAIVPPQKEGENVPQADNETPDTPPDIETPKPMVSGEVRARLTNPEIAQARAALTEAIWNFVWWRRLTYFATLTATLILLMLPLVVARLPYPPILGDGRTWVGGIIRLSTLVLPTFAGQWVEVYADNPFYFLVLAIVIFGFLGLGTWLERRLRDEARGVWKRAIDGSIPPQPSVMWIQKFRTSRRYQKVMQLFKWYFLPDWVVAPFILLLLFWTGLAMYTQSRLPFLENGSLLCQSSSAEVADLAYVREDFRTRDVCSQSFGRVVKDQHYIVSFEVVDPWYDGSFATTPNGLSAGDLPWGLGYLFVPLRRVIDASYLQPVLEVRPTEGSRNLFSSGNVQIYPLIIRADGASPNLYVADFLAPRTGELFLFANDAMIPLTSSRWGKFDYRHFYEASGFGTDQERGNRGSACVTVRRVDIVEEMRVVPPVGSVCARALARETVEASSQQPPDR